MSNEFSKSHKQHAKFPELNDSSTIANKEILDNSFSIRNIDKKRLKLAITVTFGVIGAIVITLGLNFDTVFSALSTANFYFLAIAFFFSLIPFLGASLALIFFTPEKLKLWDTIVMHIAGGIISLIFPAGIGILALNVRFLVKHKINLSLAIASVFLTQIVQVFTIFLFLIMIPILGYSLKFSIPWFWVIIVLLLSLCLLIVCAIYRPLRKFIVSKIITCYNKVFPRLKWIVANPKRIILGWLSTVMMSLGYATCFYFVILSFNYHFSYFFVVIIFLIANYIGSALPSPGGIGGVEIALSSILSILGIHATVAISIAVLYRVLTFWIRVPFGWLALNYCQHKNLL